MLADLFGIRRWFVSCFRFTLAFSLQEAAVAEAADAEPNAGDAAEMTAELTATPEKRPGCREAVLPGRVAI